jgi:ABC-type antimicrobial peptide transport system permease subunit
LEVVSTRERLALFQSVENTYLSVFLVLGGLGLLLGTVGMGWILWLNILDRRGELAMMQAVGFRRQMLAAMLVQEHTLLLAGGVLGGMLTAMPAVLPALAGRIEPAPAGMLLAELVLIVFSGWLWIRLAASAALAGPLLKALRNE